ncbi:MAG: hypothetical protein R3Y38_06655 [Rikenellaceae bacterium]
MNQMTTQLLGRWQFIAAEKFIDLQWQLSDNFVKGMQWEFCPQYISDGQSVGRIKETGPGGLTEMAYAFNHKERILKVEISSELSASGDAEFQEDVYELTSTQLGESMMIKISILSEQGSPAPYFRYCLQKIIF